MDGNGSKKELLERACSLSIEGEIRNKKSNDRYYTRIRDRNNKKAIKKLKSIFGKQTRIEIVSHRKLDIYTPYYSSTFLVDGWLKVTYDVEHYGVSFSPKRFFIRELKCPHCNQWVENFHSNVFFDLTSFGKIIRGLSFCQFCKKSIGGEG